MCVCIFNFTLSETNPFLNQLNSPLIVCKDVKRNSKGETPLHINSRKGQLQKVKELIAENNDINVKDYAGWTPLVLNYFISILHFNLIIYLIA